MASAVTMHPDKLSSAINFWAAGISFDLSSISTCARISALPVEKALSICAALRSLNIDAFPDTTPVQVQINTVAAALVPEEVERQITIPIEIALSGIPHETELRSISKFGLSQVVVLFEGRDAAGKGGVIKRITEGLNPRVCRVVALADFVFLRIVSMLMRS